MLHGDDKMEEDSESMRLNQVVDRDDKMEEDSESMGLGQVVEIGDRPQKEQVLTKSKEQTSKNHRGWILRKNLSLGDIQNRLAIPKSYLRYFPELEGETAIEFLALDSLGKQWTFKLSVNPKPMISGEWLRFVKVRGVKVGDILTIFKKSDGGEAIYRIEVSRRVFNFLSNLK